jgi:FMN-dependent NADH-azoreductase
MLTREYLMSNVLILKSSINGDASLTNQLIDEFKSQRKQAGHIDSLIERDLTALALPKLSQSLFAALRGGDTSDPAIQEGVALSNTLIGELKSSDLLVIGAPMYNLNVPIDLKKWFDLVARARETFRYTETYPQGLVENVRAVVISSRGGVHEGQSTDTVTPYLRAVLGLMGIIDVEFIYAEGIDIKPQGRDAGIAHAREHMARAAQLA